MATCTLCLQPANWKGKFDDDVEHLYCSPHCFSKHLEQRRVLIGDEGGDDMPMRDGGPPSQSQLDALREFLQSKFT